MSRPPQETVEHVVASVPRNRREVTTVSVVATGDDWHVDLKVWRTFPDGRTTLKRPGLRLGPDQLHEISAAIRSVADFRDAQAREAATAEELAVLIDKAAVHNRTIVAAVASNSAVFLKAFPDGRPFRVYVGMPFIMAIVDRDGAGPGAFDFVCLRAALRIAKLVVLTVGDRNVEHYHIVGNMAVLGDSGIVIETTGDQAECWLSILAVEVPDTTVLAPTAGQGVNDNARWH